MTDLESLILTKLGEHAPDPKHPYRDCTCGANEGHVLSAAAMRSWYNGHLASVLTEAATDAGYERVSILTPEQDAAIMDEINPLGQW